MGEKTCTQMYNTERCCYKCVSHRDPETGCRALLLLGDQRTLPRAVTQTESQQADQGGEGPFKQKGSVRSVHESAPIQSDVRGKNTGNGVKIGGVAPPCTPL